MGGSLNAIPLFYDYGILFKIKTMETQTQNVLTIPGKTLPVTLPDGLKIIIREQNGNDDDVISRIGNNDGGTNEALPLFLSNIIVSKTPDGRNYTAKDINNWRSNNQVYLMLQSRVFSLGNTMLVSFTCSECGLENPPFEEDLTPYLDLTAYPKFKYACPPYKDNASSRELTLTSGKTIRYIYKNGAIDNKTLEIDKLDLSLNTPLLIRELSVKVSEGKWQKVEIFNIFTAREMAEIRKDIGQYDPAFEAVSEFKCTNPRCKKLHKVSLITMTDFFFPGAIL